MNTDPLPRYILIGAILIYCVLHWVARFWTKKYLPAAKNSNWDLFSGYLLWYLCTCVVLFLCFWTHPHETYIAFIILYISGWFKLSLSWLGFLIKYLLNLFDWELWTLIGLSKVLVWGEPTVYYDVAFKLHSLLLIILFIISKNIKIIFSQRFKQKLFAI